MLPKEAGDFSNASASSHAQGKDQSHCLTALITGGLKRLLFIDLEYIPTVALL